MAGTLHEKEFLSCLSNCFRHSQLNLKISSLPYSINPSLPYSTMIKSKRKKSDLVWYQLYHFMGFPGGTVTNAGDARDTDLIPGSERFSGVGKWQPAPVFLPGKFHGQRSLASGAWQATTVHVTAESDLTEHAGMLPLNNCLILGNLPKCCKC